MQPACLNRLPAVVITSSGTAVANLLPAVVEAHQAGVPLLVLSADRPGELRGTGANQTIDQVSNACQPHTLSRLLCTEQLHCTSSWLRCPPPCPLEIVWSNPEGQEVACQLHIAGMVQSVCQEDLIEGFVVHTLKDCA